MKNYLVALALQVGEYEKTGYALVCDAPNEEAAGFMALALECHGNATYSSGTAWDLGGEMAYSVQSVKEVNDNELVVLCKFQNSFTFHQEQIDETFNNTDEEDDNE